MISAVEWVPKGIADPTPKKYEVSPAELDLLERQAELEAALDQDESDGEESDEEDDEDQSYKLPKIDPKSLPAELRMDEYSSDEDENDAVQGSAIGNMLVGSESEIIGSYDEQEDNDDGANDGEETDLAVRDSDDDDSEYDSDDDLADIPDTRQYMPVDVEGLQAMGLSQIGANASMNLEGMDGEEDYDSDAEDINISPDDAIMVVAKTDEDFASLEVHVYEPKTGNLFVHHDIPLPSFPLCLAHGDISNDGGAGNYCAVGTFSPGIEVWNLDVLNPLEPSFILGGEDTSAADELMKLNMSRAATGKKLKKKKKLQGGGLLTGSHTDAVMAMSWNKVHRQVLASGSSDCTVKLWDVTKAGTEGANAATFTHHRDKVQAVQWHPKEGTLLATGSYDKTISLVDARNSTSPSKCVKIPADCEAIAWDPWNPHLLTVGSEDGTLSCWDVRKFETSTPVWSFVVSEYGGMSDLSYNSHVPGMFATCSVDKTVTLWDTFGSNGAIASAPPRACGNKDMGVGKLYSLSFYASSPWLLGCGGSGNQVSLWDLTSESAVQSRFASRCTTAGESSVDTSQDTPKGEDFEASIETTDTAIKKIRENAKTRKNAKGKKKAHRKHR